MIATMVTHQYIQMIQTFFLWVGFFLYSSMRPCLSPLRILVLFAFNAEMWLNNKNKIISSPLPKIYVLHWVCFGNSYRSKVVTSIELRTFVHFCKIGILGRNWSQPNFDEWTWTITIINVFGRGKLQIRKVMPEEKNVAVKMKKNYV